MERVGVLINKLQEQLLQNADVQNMLVTAQMLHNELLFHVNETGSTSSGKVSVVVPKAAVLAPEPEKVENSHTNYKPVPVPEPVEEPVPVPIKEPETPIAEPAPVPTIKPEPEPIPHYLEQKPWNSVFPEKEEKANWNVENVLDVPTLAQQKIVYELNDTMVGVVPKSINDKLKDDKSEVSVLLQETPIRDLKKAISINDRHRFIHELFRDDETMYERSIKTINSFHIFAEAEFWIQRELKVKLGWDTSQELVKTFDQLVKRRFA